MHARTRPSQLIVEFLEDRINPVIDPTGGVLHLPVPDATFPAVGKIITHRPGQSDMPVDTLGTGTLIRSNWVLTAGHVVDWAQPWNVNFHLGGHDYTAIEIVYPRGHINFLNTHRIRTSEPDQNSDLALIKLNGVPTDSNNRIIQPIPMDYSSIRAGEWTTLVGFGLVNTGDVGGSMARLRG